MVSEATVPVGAVGLSARRISRPALIPVVSVVAGLVLWEVVARVWQVSFFPPASSVLVRMAELLLGGKAAPLLLASMADLLIAFVFSAVVGVVVGLLMGIFWRVDGALLPFVTALLAAPVIVFAPVFFAVFGFSRITVQAIIVVHCVFVIISNVRDGARSVRADQAEMARLFGANWWQHAVFVVLPASMPLAAAGLRIGFGRAVKGMINGEMFIAVVGLGGMLVSAGRVFDAEGVLAILGLTVLVALIGTSLLSLIERRLLHWYL